MITHFIIEDDIDSIIEFYVPPLENIDECEIDNYEDNDSIEIDYSVGIHNLNNINDCRSNKLFIFGQNYNTLRILSGMGGLQYSN